MNGRSRTFGGEKGCEVLFTLACNEVGYDGLIGLHASERAYVRNVCNASISPFAGWEFRNARILLGYISKRRNSRAESCPVSVPTADETDELCPNAQVWREKTGDTVSK